ncbi:MAG: BMP family ABC transporter substrate-binding protein [Glaciimonas sp.]|nr:BMP family ABC transporter substrate-binding protein [Glaciimonas sp.]
MSNIQFSRASNLLLSLFLMAGSVQAAELAKIIYVRPVLQNDDAFLQQGTNGIKQAAIMYQLQASTLESQPTRAGRQQQLDNAIKQGAKIIVMLGYEFKELAAGAALAAPKTRFLLLENCVDKPPANLTCINFLDNEVNYLAGMEAALTSTTGKIGMVGAIGTALKRKNAEAFNAGAKSVNPNIVVRETLWIDGAQPFNDTHRAEAHAKTLLAEGVDVIFTAAAASNHGVFKAVSGQTKAKAIGSDINQCPQAPGKILDNVQTHADTAIGVAVGLIMGGSMATHMDFGLKEGAVSLTGLGLDAAYSECDILRQRPVIVKLREASMQIVRGTRKLD